MKFYALGPELREITCKPKQITYPLWPEIMKEINKIESKGSQEYDCYQNGIVLQRNAWLGNEPHYVPLGWIEIRWNKWEKEIFGYLHNLECNGDCSFNCPGYSMNFNPIEFNITPQLKEEFVRIYS